MEQNDEIICFYDPIKKEEEVRSSFEKELKENPGKEENIRFIRDYYSNLKNYVEEKKDLLLKDDKPIKFNQALILKQRKNIIKIELGNIIQNPFENELNIIQEIYKNFNFPMDLDTRKSELDQISDTNEIKKKFNCSKHADKQGFFFCDKHRNEEILCEVCCENHIRENSNLGIDEAVKQIDYEKHAIYYIIPYVYNKMLSGLNLFRNVFSKYNKVTKIANLSKNYHKLIDYNNFFVEKTIDQKCDEMIQIIEEYRIKMKKNLNKNHLKFKEKKEFQYNWEALKKEISDDYYSIHHSVVGKIARFKFKISELIKNSLEEIKQENLNMNKNIIFNNLDNKLIEDFNNKNIPIPELQPTFCGIKFDLNSIKNSIKDKFHLLLLDSKSIKYDPLDNIDKDLDYIKTKIKINFIADKCYKTNINSILNEENIRGGKFPIAEPEEVVIKDSNGQRIENDFYKNMILPINSEVLYIDDQFYNKRFKSKIIAIGGIYNKKDGTSYPNHVSVLDISSKILYQNIYSLKYLNQDNLSDFERIGLKCCLVTSDELKPKRNLRDYYNLLIFGGNTTDGVSTQDLYLIKGIQFLLQKNPEDIITIDKEKRSLELELINAKIPNIYSEVLKIDGRVYFLGGMTDKGDYSDEIHCYTISQEKFEKLPTVLPLTIQNFSVISDDINKNKFYLVGGHNQYFKENLSLFRFEIQDKDIKITKLLNVKNKKIKPKLLVREKHLFIFGGHNFNLDYFLEVVDLNHGYCFPTNMLFNNLVDRFSNKKICLNNLGMLTFIN